MELRTLRYFVAVAEELHFGRAAARLHMSQPPLSRAIRRLETDVGAQLFRRSSTGVALTPPGAVLLEEARALLDQTDRLRRRVAAAAGDASITVGILGDNADSHWAQLADTYRRLHPGVDIGVRGTDLTDPTCGLRTGLVDVALTRAPFDETGLAVTELRTEPVGALLRTDDPLARRRRLTLADLSRRRWFRFPEGTDPLWQSYWHGGRPRQGPVVHTVQECQQSVLWNGTVGMTLLDHEPPAGLTVLPVIDMPPNRRVLAWHTGRTTPRIHSFVDLATTIHRVTPAGAAALSHGRPERHSERP
ncbi:LysR family transcriptional regulator [Tsukamurella sp. 8F]|uniref:LysR family transcriptional regulator n=1 Tax=unclassified Tsukamurella TaxID=2633480 RepID=UPI0023B924CC|nr:MULTISPECIES: LysR family transcriptional regulator [unclassified Tsukamurella]MDF0528868.1 LysR family transcriptional regulator [Tsukamurella sp. 8J]MDF0586703.1 LysR family transcriptional regulator [Tsukamurella sp. 8F]